MPCSGCGRTESPLWRKGPDGPGTLCNACGLHYGRFGVLRGETPSKAVPRDSSRDHRPQPVPVAVVPTVVPVKPLVVSSVACTRCGLLRCLPTEVDLDKIGLGTWSCERYPIREFALCNIRVEHWSVIREADWRSPSASGATSPTVYDDTMTEGDTPDIPGLRLVAWAPFRLFCVNLSHMFRESFPGATREFSELFALTLLQVLVRDTNALVETSAELLYDSYFIERVQALFGEGARSHGILPSVFNLLRRCLDPVFDRRPTAAQVVADVRGWPLAA